LSKKLFCLSNKLLGHSLGLDRMIPTYLPTCRLANFLTRKNDKAIIASKMFWTK
jgi:hypothetical protein